ncbi:MAG: YraN family protein [Hyphomicrobium sp.]
MATRTGDSGRRRARERQGQWSERLAAAVLMAKGYRILARRWSCPLGEIDLVAARGRRLAFVEVKQRASREMAEASITPMQSRRVRDAADLWLARNARYHDHDMHFDAVFVLPWTWPLHVPDGL